MDRLARTIISFINILSDCLAVFFFFPSISLNLSTGSHFLFAIAVFGESAQPLFDHQYLFLAPSTHSGGERS